MYIYCQPNNIIFISSFRHFQLVSTQFPGVIPKYHHFEYAFDQLLTTLVRAGYKHRSSQLLGEVENCFCALLIMRNLQHVALQLATATAAVAHLAMLVAMSMTRQRHNVELNCRCSGSGCGCGCGCGSISIAVKSNKGAKEAKGGQGKRHGRR